MNNLEITYETPTTISISLTDLASRNGTTFANITDVIFMLKEKSYDDDADAVVSKDYKTTNGVTLDSVGGLINVSILEADFGVDKIEVRNYLICLGVEFSDSGSYIEDYDPNESWIMKINGDKIRD